MGKIINKPKIIVVLGPTATGKSDLAVNIAKKLGRTKMGGYNGEIISADSRQVFKGMDLGSGKITKKEMLGIPHHLLDIVKPSTFFSMAKYKELADKKIKEIISKGKTPIICGGTGYYIDSVVKNIVLPEVKLNLKYRKELEKKSTEKLFELLKKLSPERAKTIDKNNKVRLMRALEIAKELGSVPVVIEKPSEYDFIFIGLDTKDQILKDRIALRLIKRIKIGMIKEIQRIHDEGTTWKRLESFGLEYKNTALFLQNKITKEEMIDNLNREIWQFVKRQRTWFKRNKQIAWFDIKDKNYAIKVGKLINNNFRLKN
ncbi:MAG: tRNA (adenosine(37)-N6)-dimethylallyltransferase MiaA [Candidatus Pacebacteria bacterium]|nr:tRNA (adenosine(37)-N6)-dimethylallyltransferase MiaA [Candidatus Paceibacterota bacterium]